MTINEKILLVDDEPNLLKSWQALLREEGYQVDTAAGGGEALDALAAEPYGLLLLDLNMPGIDGLQVMERIRDQGLNVSIVVVSGETSFEWVSRAFLLGAYDYLQKPFELEALLNTVGNALKKRELETRFSNLRRQLERSERLHRFMIESSPDLIFIIDREGNIAFVNERAKDLLGYRKDELEGHHYSSIVMPEYREKARHWFRERRTGERATRDAEVWLQCNTDASAHKHAGRDKIAIELNAMGVYEEGEELNVDPGPGARRFSGTYVVARDITDRLASEQLIHYQAYHDLLTGLPNRALFLDRLNMAINNARRRDQSVTIMFLDLDRFKIVNDTLGHSVGDKLLQGVTRRLRNCLRDSDTLSRIGGDEFIVLLPNVETADTAHTVADKIVSAIKDPFPMEGHEIFVTASIGIAIYPHDGETAETLIKNADIAMYHTKDQGKNGYHLYHDHMSSKQHKLLRIENDIRRGIKEDQFEVFYQPQVNAEEESIIGVEALLRWNHPERGLLSPAFFLGVAEETGLMVELGDWVLHTALREVQSWREAGIRVDKLAINFSPRQIEQPDFVDKVVSALKQHNFPGHVLEVEITENSLMHDIQSTIGKLRQLHNVGVNVAIDDFGTGFSSLSLLQKLPINRLKIDKSFIQDMTEDSDRSIIEAIAHMARGLKLDMVAEGVEREFQLKYLRQLKCPVVQGFIYSQGVPADKARQLVSGARAVFASSTRTGYDGISFST